MQVTCNVDVSNLMRAQKILMRHSSRTPARCLNSTAYHVIKDVIEAGGGFPVVAQATIDTDMEVTVTPKIAISGKRKGLPLRSGATDIDIPDFSTATLIVMARMNPNSKYSLSTGNRWPLPKIRIRDFAKAYGDANALQMFFEAIRPMAERMVRARHSSTGFLKKSWIDVKVALAPFAFGKSSSTGAISTDYSEIKPANAGGPLAVCVVSNTLGVGLKTTKELSESYNSANHRIGEPRLQAAVNREFDKKMKVANAKEWASSEPELKELGLLVAATP